MAGDLDKTIAWRREKLESMGVPVVKALRMATERNKVSGGFLVDVHYVEALIAKGATVEQACDLSIPEL